MFAVDLAVFVHVMNLERLTTDRARGDVVVITTEKDGLRGELKVFSLSEVTNEHVVFIDVCAHSANKSNNSESEEPPSEVGFGQTFVTRKFLRGSPIDD